LKPVVRPSWRQRLKWSPLYGRLVRPWRDGLRLRRWRRAGRPPPPPGVWKRRLAAAHAQRFATPVFIETGTGEGELTAMMAARVRKVVSIELDPRLAELARHRFRDHADVEILEGDSEQLLPDLLAGIAEPCIFWLDAHATTFGTRGRRVTPIRHELGAILAHPVTAHVVLIDDARLFAAGGGHPSLEELRTIVAAARPEWLFQVADDVLRLLPPKPARPTQRRADGAAAG
jgi:hypothetical protein